MSVKIQGQLLSRFRPGKQAFQADSFVDSVGFAGHLSYDGTNYVTNFAAFFTLFTTSHLRHFRDGVNSNWNQQTVFVQNMATLCAAGVKLCLIVDFAMTETGLANFYGWINGGVFAWEGANESDVNNDMTQGVAQMPMLRASANALGIKVVGMSMTSDNGYTNTGSLQSFLDYNNLHVYYGGRNPDHIGWGGLVTPYGDGYANTRWWMYTSRRNAVNIPLVVTETGYPAAVTPTPYTCDEITQGVYLIRTLLMNYLNGVSRTYIYEFLDEGTDSGEGTYGVVRSNMTPKPAYNAIKNLLSLLVDAGTVFAPDRLQYTITGINGALRQLLFQKRNGTFFLVVWLEASRMNEANNAVSAVPSQSGTLTLVGKSLQTSHAFALDGTMTTQAISGTSAAIAVAETLTVFEIN